MGGMRQPIMIFEPFIGARLTGAGDLAAWRFCVAAVRSFCIQG